MRGRRPEDAFTEVLQSPGWKTEWTERVRTANTQRLGPPESWAINVQLEPEPQDVVDKDKQESQ